MTHEPSLFGANSQVWPTCVHFCGVPEGDGPALPEGQPARSEPKRSARAARAVRSIVSDRNTLLPAEVKRGPIEQGSDGWSGAPGAARELPMIAPLPLVALTALKEISEDGSTDANRTLLGALAILVIFAVVIGIGQLMTGGERSAR